MGYQFKIPESSEWIDIDEGNLRNEIAVYFGVWAFNARLWLDTWGFLKHPLNGIEFRVTR